MERLSVKLAAVLGVQLVLALILWSLGPDHSAFEAKEPLLAFDGAKVDRIEIGESGANSVALVKEDGKWAIPSFAGFPADGAKVSGLMTKLAGLKKGWPVASSADAAKRFKLLDSSHERKIVLKSGGKTVGEIMLGTAPSFKQVHVRAGNDSNIYAVAFAAYEAGTRGEDWLDRSLLNIPQDKIASISVGDVTLERKDGKYVLSGLKPDEKPNDAAIYRLTSAIAFPAFDAVTGKGPEAQAQVKEPTVEVTVKLAGAGPVILRYKKGAAGGAYLFASTANSFVFRASEAAVEAIVNAKREKLIEAPKKPDGEAAQAATQPVNPEAPQAGGTQAATRPLKPAAPQAEATQAAVQPAKPEVPQAKAAQAATQPARPETPQAEGTEAAAQAAKTDSPQAEGAQAAAQPAKPEGPRAEGDQAATPPAKADGSQGEGVQAATPPAKAEEPQMRSGR